MYMSPGSQPVTLDTIYDIASLTKVFTATAAFRLMDAGKLNLQAPVHEYLPGFRAPDVRVFHLLTHTSGLNLRLSTHCRAGASHLLEAVYAAPTQHPPGTTVTYTNINSLLLGQIVARISGQSLDQAIHTLVLEPLQLNHTIFCPSPDLLPQIVPTEIDETWRGKLMHGHVHDESAYALGGIAGHAGLFSTASDLYRFCLAWLEAQLNHSPGNRLLHQQTALLACSDHTPGMALACGLGWMINRPNFMGNAPHDSFGHTGFTGPAIVAIPYHQLIIVVLSNRVYPRRGPPDHHAVTAAIVNAALQWI